MRRVKTVEKGCQEAFLLQRVEQVGSRCFAGCGAKPVARGTKCWTDCFYDTVVGPRSNSTVYPDGRLHGMAGADLTAAWLQAFHSSDPAEGGCPDVGRRRWLKTTDDHLEAMHQEQQQQQRASPVTITVDTDAAVARHHGRLHGVTIDTFSLMRGLDFSAPALLEPAKLLQPALLRVGGSAQRSYPVCFGPDHPEATNSSCLTRRTWAALCGFASALNTSLIMGLHNDATSNLQLIAAVAANRSACPALLGFSVGNEGVPGSSSVFRAIRRALDAMPAAPTLPKLLLVGPESPMMSDNSNYFVPLATKLINQVGDVLSAATFHFYAFGAGDLGVSRGVTTASLTAGNLSHMWSASRYTGINQIQASVSQFKAVLANTSHPELPIWLSETNSIHSGGVDGLTNAYANVPYVLNQLGQVALAGVPVMAQQTLIGNDYGLLSGPGDRAQAAGWVENVTARPNFFAQLLHSRLTSGVVLNASAGVSGDAAAFAYCTPASLGKPRGAVTLVLLNLAVDAGPRDFHISADSVREVHALLGQRTPLPAQPSPSQIVSLLTSASLHLNGAASPLTVENAARMAPAVRPKGSAVALGGLGVAFVVLPDAKAAAC